MPLKRLAAAALAAAIGFSATLAVQSPAGLAKALTPVQQEPETCTLVPSKTAAPSRIELGETVTVTLSLDPRCPAASFRSADIMLVIDRSRSMLSAGKLDAAKAAAKTFVQVTDMSIHQVGVVGFHESAQLEQALTQNESDITDAIDNLNISTGTNISDAIDVSWDELQANGRPDALPVIILITDGGPNRPRSDPSGAAVRSANFAKLGGTEIFAVGLGQDVDATLLGALVSADSNYYFAPDASELEIVYRTIALLVGDFAVRDLVLDDELTAEVNLVAGSASPGPSVNGKNLRWRQGLIPTDGYTWTYQVRPSVTGQFPTNVVAFATYRDVKGEIQRVDFPVPMIEVVEPEPDEPEICSVRDAWTITVHSFPDAVGTSTRGRGCNNTFDSGDWSAGNGRRIPELEYELTDARGDTLFRGSSPPGSGRVDQWLYIRVCTPPPYTLRLVTDDLDGYVNCENSPLERQITERDFYPRNFQRHSERFGYIPTPMDIDINIISWP